MLLWTAPAVAHAPDCDSAEEETEPAPKPQRTGLIDLNGTYDTRGFGVYTVVLLANLPARVQYFSMTNYAAASGAERYSDLEGFYSEQNLRVAPAQKVPIAATAQWVVRSGPANDTLRLGARWRVGATPGLKDLFAALRLNYSVNVHIVQSDFAKTPGWSWQMEHAYRARLFPDQLDGRVYVAGFADHNIVQGGSDGAYSSRVVTEHQLGVRTWGQLYAVVEARRNEFMDQQPNGLGVGLEYMMPLVMR